MLSRFLMTTVLVALVLVPATAVALDYWPTPDATRVYHFATGQGATSEAVFTSEGAAQHMLETWAQCTGAHDFSLYNGSLILWQRGTMCEGWVDPDVSIFLPALPVVPEAMAAGDAWAWEGVVIDAPGVIIFNVTAETITVPAGTFETLRLHATVYAAPVEFEDWWLDRELGPVKMGDMELVSVEDVVAVQPRSWSSIKALF